MVRAIGKYQLHRKQRNILDIYIYLVSTYLNGLISFQIQQVFDMMDTIDCT